MRYWMTVLFASLAVMLSGCSVVGMGYSRLDWVTLMWLDRYMDFSSEQKEALRPLLKGLLHWHREQELPAYQNLIEARLEPLLQQEDIRPAQWLDIMDTLKMRYEALAKKSGNMAEPVLGQLKPEQIDHLKAALDKSNVKFRKKHLDPSMEEIRSQRAEDFVEFIDDWLGKLTEAQMRAIDESYRARVIDNKLWRDERQVRQQLILQALQRKPGEQTPTLSDAFVALLEPVSPKGQLYLERTHKDTAELLSRLWALSSPQQKQQARDKAASWKKEVRRLM
jgi:hypothetical protein